MLTKYKFLISNRMNAFSRTSKNLVFQNTRYFKFSSPADTKSTVRIF